MCDVTFLFYLIFYFLRQGLTVTIAGQGSSWPQILRRSACFCLASCGIKSSSNFLCYLSSPATCHGPTLVVLYHVSLVPLLLSAAAACLQCFLDSEHTHTHTHTILHVLEPELNVLAALPRSDVFLPLFPTFLGEGGERVSLCSFGQPQTQIPSVMIEGLYSLSFFLRQNLVLFPRYQNYVCTSTGF